MNSSVTGEAIYEFAKELFPICRSITGNGVRETLGLIRRRLPELTITEVPTGTRCFDWEMPLEWNIREAWIEDQQGERILDFRDNNLHVVSYSEPVDADLSLDELQPHLFSLPEQPQAIPYVTSYYKRFWGFCITHDLRSRLRPGRYRVRIDSSLAAGSLTYGELVIPGQSRREVFSSTYVCHPSMANNEVSGPALATFLAIWLKQQPRRFTYRFAFVPETIGAIAYLSTHFSELKANVHAAFQITCVGDERLYSFLPSRLGNTLTDRVALHVLKHTAGDFKPYAFTDRGSDERQYCSPGIDLPMVSIMRSKYGDYPEYHTSRDNLDFISPKGLDGSYNIHVRCLEALEGNHKYRNTCLGEPQLGKRGLRPSLGGLDNVRIVKNMMNVLAYSDGNHDLVQIADLLGVPVFDLLPLAHQLEKAKLLEPACEFI